MVEVIEGWTCVAADGLRCASHGSESASYEAGGPLVCFGKLPAAVLAWLTPADPKVAEELAQYELLEEALQWLPETSINFADRDDFIEEIREMGWRPRRECKEHRLDHEGTCVYCHFEADEAEAEAARAAHKIQIYREEGGKWRVAVLSDVIDDDGMRVVELQCLEELRPSPMIKPIPVGCIWTSTVRPGNEAYCWSLSEE